MTNRNRRGVPWICPFFLYQDQHSAMKTIWMFELWAIWFG